MNCSIPGFPVLHHLLEFAQIHVHSVGDAIQLSHPHPLLVLPSVFPSIRVFSNVKIMQGSGVKQQISSLTVLEVRNMKWVSVDRNQSVGRIMLLARSSRKSPFLCRFHLLEAFFIPWLVVPSSICNSSNIRSRLSHTVLSLTFSPPWLVHSFVGPPRSARTFSHHRVSS